MENTLHSLITIFILIIPGLVCGKKNLITEDQVKGMSSFIMNIVLPALIISSMQIEFEYEYINSSLKIFLYLCVILTTATLLGYLLHKVLGLSKNYFSLISFILFFANTGGIGLPIVNTLFGKECMFYAGIIEISVDILLFTFGVILIQTSGENNIKIDFKKIISPGFIGIIIGISSFIFKIKIPNIIINSFDKLGATSLPLAMFVIGHSLGQIKFKQIFGDYRIYIVTIVKMMLFPIFVYITSKYIFNFNYIISSTITVLMAMPTGSAVVIFSQEYKADYIFASKCVILTTVASIITLFPLISLITSKVY